VPLKEFLVRYHDTLVGCLDVHVHYSGDPGRWEANQGSLAAQELSSAETGPAGPWGPAPVRTAYAYAEFMMMGVTDHLAAISSLLASAVGATPPAMPALAVPVLTRSAIDLGAQAFWLLDPDIGARERVARLQTMRLDSAREGVRAVTSAGFGDDAHEYSETEESVAERSGDWGLAERTDKHGKVLGYEQVLPGATVLAEQLLSAPMGDTAAAPYRLYSGITHGKLYALMQLTATKDFALTESLAPRPLAPDRQSLRAALEIAIAAWLFTMDRAVMLFGWDDSRWVPWFNQCIDLFNEDPALK